MSDQKERYYRCLQSPAWSQFSKGQVIRLKDWELETLSSSAHYEWESATEKEYIMQQLS